MAIFLKVISVIGMICAFPISIIGGMLLGAWDFTKPKKLKKKRRDRANT